jgi:hypothetical protein
MKEKQVKKETVIEVEPIKQEDNEVKETQYLDVKHERSLTPNNKEAINTLDSLNSMEEMMSFSKVLVDSKIVPFSTAEQVATVVLQGRELGLSPVTALYNIYFIENKPTLSVHSIAALLKTNGIAFKLIKDAVTIGEGDSADLVTTIRFYYNSTIGKGNHAKIVTFEQDSTFTWRDAAAAGVTSKANWQKHPKAMLYSRAMSQGARRVAPDVLMGLMETTELADSNGVEYKLDSEGNLINN